MPTATDDQSSEPPSGNVQLTHQADPATPSVSKSDSFSSFSFLLPSQQSRRPAAPSLSSMDTHASFVSSEYTVVPDGQSMSSRALLNTASNQFTSTFQSFGNMQGIESIGSAAAAAEDQVPKSVVVDKLLERAIWTTQDAREAYSRGRDSEGSQRVAELKAVVDVISSFVTSSAKAASTLNVIPLSEQRVSPPSGRSASRKASLSGPTPPLQAPVEDASRKRCASAQGDRVLKSLKLEPKDDSVSTTLSSGPSSVSSSSGLPGSLSGPPSATLSAPPAPAAVLAQTPIPPPLLHSQTYPVGAHPLTAHPTRTSHMPSHIDPLSLPTAFPTLPSSRTEPSAGGSTSNAAIAHQLALMQQQQQQHHLPLHPLPLHSHSHSHSAHHAPTMHSPLGLTMPKASSIVNGHTPAPTGWPDNSMMAPTIIPTASTAQVQTQAQQRFRPPGSSDASSHSNLFQSSVHPHPHTSHTLTHSVRPSRSSSYSGTYPFAFNVPSNVSTTGLDDNLDAPRPSTAVSVADSSSPDLESDRENSPGRSRGGDGYIMHHPNNEIPPEIKADVDRIFFSFLSMICSDLDATDSKGEPIHQPLMAKKMQRLDESPDFRPFKFRIQAFTNGFLEDLAKQGLSEDIIPMKKVRHYLWTNAYISRFNEDGKKAKSKGNHIWNIDAKKAPEGGWHFRPFRRKIAGSFPGVAYVGLKWQFHPRVWDPQASRSNLHVRFSSPSLPTWLGWSGDVLSGTPSADTQSTEIMVEARFLQDGQEVNLSQRYFLSVAPLSRDEPSAYMNGRRPSLASDRRGVSDSAVSQATRILSRFAIADALFIARPASQSNLRAPAPYHEALTVVTEAIKAVSIEAHSVQASPNPDPEQQIQLQTFLTRQEQVLTVTAHAINDAMSPPFHLASEQHAEASQALARAGTDVVICALHKVAADHSAVIQMATGLPAEFNSGMSEVTMHEVSSATKTAVAQAVEQTNTLTSPIDVMLAAETIIQRNTQPVPATLPGDQFPLPAAVSTTLNGTNSFPSEMPILSDYAMTDIIPP
ncbi:hypothetical protein K439DRAFT_1614339 [Ramaria rubella]|nr:hypothetical protein K439DRAFT_1614339 [Ramaria rubella]